MNKVFASIVFGVGIYLKTINIWFPISLILLIIGVLYKIALNYLPVELIVLKIVIQVALVLLILYLMIGITQIACGQVKNDFVHSNITTLITPFETLWEPMGILVLFSTMLYFGSIVVIPALVVWVLFQLGLWFNLEEDAHIIRSFQLSILAFKRNPIAILVLNGYILLLLLTGYFLVFVLPFCVPIAILTISHFYHFGLSRHFY
jgi:hypothetical protein